MNWVAEMKFYMDGEMKNEEETGDEGSTSAMEKMQDFITACFSLS